MATAYEENKKARQAFIPEEEADVRTAAWSRRRNNVAKAQSKCYCLTSLSLPKSGSDEGDLQGCSISYVDVDGKQCKGNGQWSIVGKLYVCKGFSDGGLM